MLWQEELVDHPTLKNNAVSEMELYEILEDYLNGEAFKAHYQDKGLSWDGWGEYQRGKDIESLWNLVPTAPEVVAYALIENLPPGSGLRSDIPEDVLNGLSEHQIATLLERGDIYLQDLRKKVFWSSDKSTMTMFSAVHVNFDLDNDEFAKLLSMPDEEKNERLVELGNCASDLRPCILDAVSDVLGLGEDRSNAQGRLEFMLSNRISEIREKDIRDLRLYRLARNAAPWEESYTPYVPEGKLEFLTECIVDGNTWATFSAFSEKWDSGNFQHLEKYLPRLYELDEDDVYEDDEDIEAGTDSADSGELAERIEEKLSEIKSSLTVEDDEAGRTLAAAFSDLLTLVASLQDTYQDEIALLTLKVDDLRAKSEWHILISIAIGVVALVILYILWQ